MYRFAFRDPCFTLTPLVGTFVGGNGGLNPHTLHEEGDKVHVFLDGRWVNGTIHQKHYGDQTASFKVLSQFREPPERPIDLSSKPRVAKWVCSYKSQVRGYQDAGKGRVTPVDEVRPVAKRSKPP